VASNIDELFEEMERDELEDATTLTPREYAKLRGIYPQRVYTAMRTGKLTWERCSCNRRVVVVEEADRLFNKGRYATTEGRDGERRQEDLPPEEAVARSGLEP
jgi:hypothetical protein